MKNVVVMLFAASFLLRCLLAKHIYEDGVYLPSVNKKSSYDDLDQNIAKVNFNLSLTEDTNEVEPYETFSSGVLVPHNFSRPGAVLGYESVTNSKSVSNETDERSPPEQELERQRRHGIVDKSNLKTVYYSPLKRGLVYIDCEEIPIPVPMCFIKVNSSTNVKSTPSKCTAPGNIATIFKEIPLSETPNKEPECDDEAHLALDLPSTSATLRKPLRTAGSPATGNRTGELSQPEGYTCEPIQLGNDPIKELAQPQEDTTNYPTLQQEENLNEPEPTEKEINNPPTPTNDSQLPETESEKKKSEQETHHEQTPSRTVTQNLRSRTNDLSLPERNSENELPLAGKKHTYNTNLSVFKPPKNISQSDITAENKPITALPKTNTHLRKFQHNVDPELAHDSNPTCDVPTRSPNSTSNTHETTGSIATDLRTYKVIVPEDLTDDATQLKSDPVDNPTLSEAKPSDATALSKGEFSMLAEAGSTDKPTLLEATSSDATALSRGEPSDNPMLEETDPTDKPTLLEATPSDATELSRGEPSDNPMLAETDPTDKHHKPTLLEATPSDATALSKGEPSDNPMLAEENSTDKPTLLEATPSDATALLKGEPSDNPMLAETDPTDKPTLSEATPSDATTLSKGEPSGSPMLAEAKSSDKTTLSEATPSDATTLSKGEPLDNPTPTLTEEKSSDKPTLVEAKFSNNPTLPETDTSDNSTLSKGDPLENLTLSEAEALDDATLSKGEPLEGPTQSEAELLEDSNLVENENTKSPASGEDPTSNPYLENGESKHEQILQSEDPTKTEITSTKDPTEYSMLIKGNPTNDTAPTSDDLSNGISLSESKLYSNVSTTEPTQNCIIQEAEKEIIFVIISPLTDTRESLPQTNSSQISKPSPQPSELDKSPDKSVLTKYRLEPKENLVENGVLKSFEPSKCLVETTLLDLTEPTTLPDETDIITTTESCGILESNYAIDPSDPTKNLVENSKPFPKKVKSIIEPREFSCPQLDASSLRFPSRPAKPYAYEPRKQTSYSHSGRNYPMWSFFPNPPYYPNVYMQYLNQYSPYTSRGGFFPGGLTYCPLYNNYT